MTTITKNAFALATPITTKNVVPATPIKERYLQYAEQQGNNRLVWYCKALLVLPCAVMVPMAIVMMHLTPTYAWYMGLLILLLFTNVIAHVAQVSGRIFIPIYHATITTMVLIPLVTYLLTL